MALQQTQHLNPPSCSAIASGDGKGSLVPFADGGDDGNRVQRLPRWTRQEILVLIQGKKVVESRVRRGRTAGSLEPKWASVSSYCKIHGVIRGPVQCRKRWSNLAGDYKKIKEWETQISSDCDSFWLMRNDLRRERKLPGFFDRDVYDILVGGGGAVAEPVTKITLPDNEKYDESQEDTEALFDSGRSAEVEDGLFSDFEATGSPLAATEIPPNTTVHAPVPISEKQYQPTTSFRGPSGQGAASEKNPGTDPGKKRKRVSGDDDWEASNVYEQLVRVLDRNCRMMSAGLEAQNKNWEMEREQRHDHAGSFIAILNKLADALVRIADKL